MNILIGILTVLLILLSLFIVLLVLIQKPRADSGLGTAMGGGMAEATFGAETGNVLTRATIYSSVAFFVLAFALYLFQLREHKHPTGVRSDDLPTIKSEAPATPPAPATAPEAAPTIAPAPAPATAPSETPAAPKP